MSYAKMMTNSLLLAVADDLRRELRSQASQAKVCLPNESFDRIFSAWQACRQELKNRNLIKER